MIIPDNIKNIILSPNAELRPLQQPDVYAIFHAIDSQREYLRKWLPFVDKTKSIEDTNKFVRASICDALERKEYTFTIQYSGDFAGIIGLKDIDLTNLKTEIGYWLCQEFQGLGLMTQAVKELCNFSFKQLRMNRVQIKCAVGNTRSKRIPLRLGFAYEGIERDGELMSDGHFTDLDIYSILKSEMKNKKNE